MTRIICLVGASGTGKSTIAGLLEERVGYPQVKSYTTRKPRYEGEDTHTFIDGFMIIPSKHGYHQSYEFIENNQRIHVDEDGMTAYEELYGEHYFITEEQYKGKGTSIYVTSPNGAVQTKENTDCEVITMYLQADGISRVDRLSTRWHRLKQLPEYQKNGSFLSEEAIELKKEIVDERIRIDKEIFKSVECDYCIDANREIEEVYKDVLEVIE